MCARTAPRASDSGVGPKIIRRPPSRRGASVRAARAAPRRAATTSASTDKRDLGRRHGRDVEADGRVDARDGALAMAQFLEPRHALRVGAAAAEGADVEAGRAQRDVERRVVQLRVVGEGDDGGAPVRRQGRHGLVRPVEGQGHAGEALGRGEGAARIDHGHREAERQRHRHQRLRDMHRADHDQAHRRVVRMDEPPLVRRA